MGHVAHAEEKRNLDRILADKFENKVSLGIYMNRWDGTSSEFF